MVDPAVEFHQRLAAVAAPARLLEEIFVNASVALQIFDRSGRCVVVNKAHAELFGGVVPAEYNVFEDNVHAERGIADLIRRGFAGERIATPAIWYDIRELRNLPKDTDTTGGRRISVATEMIPLPDPSGEVAHVLIVFHDQTEEHEAREDAERAARNAERARASAEKRAENSAFLAKAAGMLSTSLDLDVTLHQVASLAIETLADFCVIDLLNADGTQRRVAALHRKPEKQPLLDELQAKFPPHPGSPQPASRVMESGVPALLQYLDQGALATFTRSAEHHDLGRKLGVRSCIAFPLRVGDRILGAITIGYTETERHTEEDMPMSEALAATAAIAIDNARLFRAVEDARQQAEAANRAKDEFLAMLGHELRNPLAPIVTALDITRERDGATPERAIIDRHVDHLRRLVDDLLDVSRITRGGLDLELAPIELADAVTDGFELARPHFERQRHEVMIEVPRTLPLQADRMRLAQVVANLLINAAHYTEPGGRITVHGERRGDDIVLRVRDTGVGISADLLPTIFDRFVRGARPIDRKTGGLGLGLTIVRALTEQHRGSVTARSEGPGRGTELEVVLPARDAAAATTQRPTADVAVSKPAPSRSSELILVVDDNHDAAQLLADALGMHGFRVVVSTDPHDALTLAKEHKPTIAVVDLGLPDIDGVELARRLRVDDPNMRVIALTGYGQSSDRERTTAAGFTAHLVKPIKVSTLLPLLDQLLTSR